MVPLPFHPQMQPTLDFVTAPIWAFPDCQVAKRKFNKFTSTQQTDRAEQPCLSIVHLQGKELVGKGKHQVGEWTEAGVVHLGSV